MRRTADVPFAERLPAAAARPPVNIALLDDHEIRLDRKTELMPQAFLQVPERPPRVHRPLHAARAQALQRLKQLGHHRRSRLVMNERPIEISAEQADGRWSMVHCEDFSFAARG